MANRRCVFCGRIADLEKEALFRLPADRRHIPDRVYAEFLRARGIVGVRTDLPETCGIGSPEFSGIIYENEKPVMVTKTGRSSDMLICPSCHSELFRNTEVDAVNSAVFFGPENSGKTSLVLSLAEMCIKEGFSPDEQYRYIFNEKIYDPLDITDEAASVREGAKPYDLRMPAMIYRVKRASEGAGIVCDVMHDVADSDVIDDQSIYTTLPFAADAGHYIYCIPADRLAEAKKVAGADMEVRLDMFRMITACRHSDKKPVLHLVVTKSDLYGELMEKEDELLTQICSAYPSVRELGAYFSGLRAYTVSAVTFLVPGEDPDPKERLYSSIFG